MRIMFVFLLILLAGCTARNHYTNIPNLTTHIEKITPTAIELSGNCIFSGPGIAGFVVTRRSDLSLYDYDAIIVICHPIDGRISATIKLDHLITYIASSFVLREDHAINLAYGNQVVFKAE